MKNIRKEWMDEALNEALLETNKEREEDSQSGWMLVIGLIAWILIVNLVW